MLAFLYFQASMKGVIMHKFENFITRVLVIVGSLSIVLLTVLVAIMIFNPRTEAGTKEQAVKPKPVTIVNEVKQVEDIVVIEEESVILTEEVIIETVEAPIVDPVVPVEMTIEERIENACNAYGISFDIVLAIARLETGWFTSNAYVNYNNPGGLSVNETPMYFNTIEEGVEAFVSNLANNYFAIGLDTPEEIGAKYCPVNPEWAGMVTSLMTY